MSRRLTPAVLVAYIKNKARISAGLNSGLNPAALLRAAAIGKNDSGQT